MQINHRAKCNLTIIGTRSELRVLYTALGAALTAELGGFHQCRTIRETSCTDDAAHTYQLEIEVVERAGAKANGYD